MMHNVVREMMRSPGNHRRSRQVVAMLGLVCALAIVGCEREQPGSYPAANRADCLPDVTLTAQNGQSVSLASLKGRPVLVDFIYTTCPGPCPMLTAKFASVAKILGPAVGPRVKIVSITIDPEHDGPAQLKAYAEKQGASGDGWLFLTGSPADVERVLAAFDLRREREADGSVTHTVASFLVGPDGHQIRQYNGLTVKAETVADDVQAALAGGQARSGG
jgi:protein SCO1